MADENSESLEIELLPFTKRTTTSVNVFACLFIAKNALKLSGVTASQISELHVNHAALFSIYRQVIHQDIANQAIVLAGITMKAQTAIESLATILTSISTAPGDSAIVLAEFETIVGNAVTTMKAVNA